MSAKKLMESTLPEIFQRVLDEEAFQVIDSSYTSRVSEILFEAVSKCNWSYVWTFDRADIPENSHEIHMTDVAAHNYFNAVSYDKYHMATKDNCIVNLYTKFMKVLSQWLSDNATADDVTSISQDGVFEARVAVEGENIVKSIEVSGELKTLIKDDAAIEK